MGVAYTPELHPSAAALQPQSVRRLSQRPLLLFGGDRWPILSDCLLDSDSLHDLRLLLVERYVIVGNVHSGRQLHGRPLRRPQSRVRSRRQSARSQPN